jgi:hypothetical protein
MVSMASSKKGAGNSRELVFHSEHIQAVVKATAFAFVEETYGEHYDKADGCWEFELDDEGNVKDVRIRFYFKKA